MELKALSRPKYWWYSYVKKAVIYNIRDIQQPPETMQEAITRLALKKALDDTKQLRRGEERLKLVDLVLRRQQYNIPGAAMAMYVSESTATKWMKEFMYTVAEYMGFL